MYVIGTFLIFLENLIGSNMFSVRNLFVFGLLCVVCVMSIAFGKQYCSEEEENILTFI